MKRSLNLLLVTLLAFPFSAFGYDQVRLEKIISLVDKKSEPSVLRLDPSKNLWILNKANNTIQQISQEGKVTQILKPGKKPDSIFKEPLDFTFTKDGSLVVVDEAFSRLAIIGSESGNWKDAKIASQFALKNPLSVAVSPDDIIAVGFSNQPAIDLFSIDGVLLSRMFAPENQSIKAISSLTFAKDGTLWALDNDEGRLHRFSNEHKWLGAADGLNSAQSVAVDEYGTAYVSIAKGQWQEIKGGQASGAFGTKGKNPGQMLTPAGIVSFDSDHLWVAETGNKRLQGFQVLDASRVNKILQGPASFIQVRLDTVWQDKNPAAAYSADGNMLVMNHEKNAFEWIDKEGKTTSSWPKRNKTTAYQKPQALTIDSTDKIWITDAADDTIKNLSAKGELLKSVGQKGKKEGNLNDPSWIAVRPDGSFVVADKGNSRVQVLSSQGLFLFKVGAEGKKEGQYETISGVAANKDKIAILDNEKKSLIFYTANGKFHSEFANKDGKAAFWDDPVSINTDDKGRFYILDNGLGRVRVFDPAGIFLADYAASGDYVACGPNQKVVVLSKQEVRTYSVHFVSKELKEVEAVDEAGVIRVSWEASPEATSYRVYRSSSADHTGFLAEVPGTEYIDDKVIPNLPYTYYVSGVNVKAYEGQLTASNMVKPSRRRDISLISIEKITLNPVYTAAFKYYAGKPIGEVEIQNNDDIPQRNIKISLSLKKYGDFASETVVEELKAGERKIVPVSMTFNDSVLELTEDTPIQMDVRASYYEDNQEKSVSQNGPILLYSRNAISWSDKARIASFITPRDTPIVEFARSAIRSFLPDLKTASIGKPMAKMLLYYESLNALGMSYVPDPKTPFTEVSGKPEMLDYVQFPRETLRRKTGDCDDTTSLLSSLLESIGVQTALVDIPGHIFLMANLESSDLSDIGFPENRLVEFNGTYWLPIETTSLGKNFNTAWQSAAAKINASKDKGTMEFIPASKAHEKYAPVTLVEVDKNPVDYPTEKVKAAFLPLLEQLQNERYQNRLAAIQEQIKANPEDASLVIQLGMVHVEGGKRAEAEKAFKSLFTEKHSVEVRSSASNNLGNVAYLNGQYQDAFNYYEQAEALTPDDGGVIINKARAAWKLGRTEDVKKSLAVAQTKLKEWREFSGDIPVEYQPK